MRRIRSWKLLLSLLVLFTLISRSAVAGCSTSEDSYDILSDHLKGTRTLFIPHEDDDPISSSIRSTLTDLFADHPISLSFKNSAQPLSDAAVLTVHLTFREEKNLLSTVKIGSLSIKLRRANEDWGLNEFPELSYPFVASDAPQETAQKISQGLKEMLVHLPGALTCASGLEPKICKEQTWKRKCGGSRKEL